MPPGIRAQFPTLNLFIYCRVFSNFDAKVSPQKEHEVRSKLKDYQDKLRSDCEILPDPFSLDDGWISETETMKCWPSLYLVDISDYLKLKSPSDLCNRLINEYKQEKAFLYVI